jgi:alginate O-acetyltransferase complex protein AlgI
MPDSLQALLIFTPLALLVYYPLPRRWQNLWLLIVSYAFYAWFQWQQALILLGITAANHALQRWLPTLGARPKRITLIGGIALNIAALILIKYQIFTAWFATPAADAPDTLALIVPLGLSFVILHTIGTLIDVANGRIPAIASPIDFALYLAYFPKLIAGPIERAKAFMPQLESPRMVDDMKLARGMTLLGMGLARKVLIGGAMLHLLPEDVFVAPHKSHGLELIGSMLVYAFYLYNDFAGYTGIARGISCFFGIELAPNFQTPYFSTSFTEFWNRWHMSFSFWLRDYIFFPVSRSLAKLIPDRKHPIHRILPPLVAMLISGLWHGASLNMLLWGLLHGIYLMIRRIPFAKAAALPPDKQPVPVRVLGAIFTFIFVTLAWIPFRMPLPVAGEFVRRIANDPLGGVLPVAALLLIIPSLLLDVIEARGGELAPLAWPRFARLAALAFVLILLLAALFPVTGTTFVYQEF